LQGTKLSPVAECGQTPEIVSRPCGQELLRWNPYPSVCRSSTHRHPSGSGVRVHSFPNDVAIACPNVCKVSCDNSAVIGFPFVVFVLSSSTIMRGVAVTAGLFDAPTLKAYSAPLSAWAVGGPCSLLAVSVSDQ